MKIVVGTRCRDEAELLPIFLANYPFADTIVIADGGSIDNSKEIALQDKRVKWYDFDQKVPGKNGGWRNPEGKHMNFLIQACEAEHSEWLWITETDAIPNLFLQQDADDICKKAYSENYMAISTYLCYIASDGKTHYPELMQGPGYTAWKPGHGFANDDLEFEGQGDLTVMGNLCFFTFPYARIHLTFRSEEEIERKRQFYKLIHDWELEHPDKRCGPRAALPEWAVWNNPNNICCGQDGYEHIKHVELKF